MDNENQQPAHSTELAPLSAAIPVAQMREQVASIQALMKGLMKENEHFGVIPGTGGKPTLLKAGAEKLAFSFRLDLQPEVKLRELGNDHREYEVVTTVYSVLTGQRLGGGVGACSTKESKWRYRWQSTGQPVPKEYWDGRDPMLLGGPQFAPRKKDKSWEIFEKIEHDSPADYWNTCLKMARKRSSVDAILSTTAASDIFTQDVEEMQENRAQATGRGQGSSKAKTTKARASKTGKDSGEVDATLEKDRQFMVTTFFDKVARWANFEETQKDLEKFAKKPFAEWTRKDLAELRKLGVELVEGKKKADEVFGQKKEEGIFG